MKAMTVVQFANWLNVISSDMTKAKGGFSADEDRTLNVRLYNLAMWVLEQAEKRGALDMRIRDFMARCPAAVRDAARALVREAQEGAQPCATLRVRSCATLRVRSCARHKKERTDLMSDEDYAEMLQRMDPSEAARIQREE
jgi:hypothetical protein